MTKHSSEELALNALLWNTLDHLRGTIPMESALTVFCQLLFLKYLEDNSDRIIIDQQQFSVNFPSDKRLSKMPFHTNADEIPLMVSQLMIEVEQANPEMLRDIFTQTDIQYFDRVYGSRSGITIINMIHELSKIDFEKKYLLDHQINLADVFTGLLDRFAESELKRTGFLLTPPRLRSLLVSLSHVGAKPTESILDPTCGPGSLLIDVMQTKTTKQTDWIAYGQERYINFFSLAKIQWLLSEQDPNRIGLGDSLQAPYLAGQDQLLKVDKVVTAPPFNVSNWGGEWAEHDKFNRFNWGVPPANKADYAHILHAIASLKQDGTAIMVCAAGVLFREGQEGKLRRKLIDENIISALIWLPAGLFNHWNIPMCIMYMEKSRSLKNRTMLMIDLANGLTDDNILSASQILEEYKSFGNLVQKDQVPSKIIEPDEIIANNYNLLVTRYFLVDNKTEKIDKIALNNEIQLLEKQIEGIDLEIKQLKGELKIL